MQTRVVTNKYFFLPFELSDFIPNQGPKTATTTIAEDVAQPCCWSVHPCSSTNQTEKYKPGITKAYNVFAKSNVNQDTRLFDSTFSGVNLFI